jgi:hypothetical protein
MSIVVVLAGRRVDAPGAVPERFPASQLTRVEASIEGWLRDAGASTLVCAAACGADLVALEVAGRLGLRRRVLLPYGREQFRATSVVDRPGDWGLRYDQILDALESVGDLRIETYPMEGVETYFQTNRDLLDEAVQIASSTAMRLEALVVWDGRSRGASDVTAHFLAEAIRREIPVHEILTFPVGPAGPIGQR